MIFEPFDKIPRLNRDCTITEKIDGTNAAVVILPPADKDGIEVSLSDHVAAGIDTPDGPVCVFAQSRKRLITPKNDNFGFARWVADNAEALVNVLGEGHHFGEWWGQGIQRGYRLTEKRFSLFNTGRWADPNEGLLTVPGLGVVPTIYEGPFNTSVVRACVDHLRQKGSQAAPGFMDPEGVIVWHDAARQLFKVTLKDDAKPKGAAVPSPSRVVVPVSPPLNPPELVGVLA